MVINLDITKLVEHYELDDVEKIGNYEVTLNQLGIDTSELVEIKSYKGNALVQVIVKLVQHVGDKNIRDVNIVVNFEQQRVLNSNHYVIVSNDEQQLVLVQKLVVHPIENVNDDEHN